MMQKRLPKATYRALKRTIEPVSYTHLPAYELTLIPFAGTGGRIASFPLVVER